MEEAGGTSSLGGAVEGAVVMRSHIDPHAEDLPSLVAAISPCMW
jgi:hypothetical protein